MIMSDHRAEIPGKWKQDSEELENLRSNSKRNSPLPPCHDETLDKFLKRISSSPSGSDDIAQLDLGELSECLEAAFPNKSNAMDHLTSVIPAHKDA